MQTEPEAPREGKKTQLPVAFCTLKSGGIRTIRLCQGILLLQWKAAHEGGPGASSCTEGAGGGSGLCPCSRAERCTHRAQRQHRQLWHTGDAGGTVVTGGRGCLSSAGLGGQRLPSELSLHQFASPSLRVVAVIWGERSQSCLCSFQTRSHGPARCSGCCPPGSGQCSAPPAPAASGAAGPGPHSSRVPGGGRLKAAPTAARALGAAALASPARCLPPAPPAPWLPALFVLL